MNLQFVNKNKIFHKESNKNDNFSSKIFCICVEKKLQTPEYKKVNNPDLIKSTYYVRKYIGSIYYLKLERNVQ